MLQIHFTPNDVSVGSENCKFNHLSIGKMHSERFKIKALSSLNRKNEESRKFSYLKLISMEGSSCDFPDFEDNLSEKSGSEPINR